MTKSVEIDNENFQEVVANGTHLIELGGDGCSGCIALKPIVMELLPKYPDVIYHNVVVTHRTSEICHRYEIDRIPALLIIHNGVLVASVKGFQPAEILDLWLEDVISKLK